MSKKPLMMAFDEKGNLYESIRPWMSNNPNYIIKMEEAKDFTDTLEFMKVEDYYRGASRIRFKSVSNDREFTMYLDDFGALVKVRAFNNNQVVGTFRFAKRGTSQAIKLIIENPATP